MRTLASWCFRHRRIVVVGWLLLVVALVGLSQAAGTSFDNSLALPKTDSTQALHLLQANAPAQSGDSEQVVIASKGGTAVTDVAVRTQAEALFAKLGTLPHVTGVTSPFTTAGADQISTDRTVAFATLHYDKPGDVSTVAMGKLLVDTARSFRSPTLDVAVDGTIAIKGGEGGLGGVGLGILAAGLVLLVIFGSLLAASLPLVSTLVALPAAISGVALASHVVAMPDFVGQIVVLIGLGVGVDYALFIVTRMRQGLQSGRDVESAIVNAVATSGRAVLFAGAVVCVALLGLLTLGVGLLSGIGVAASIGVLFTMATSLTLLPALLGFFGPKVLSRRQRRAIAVQAPLTESGIWWRWSAMVARRPGVPAVLAVLVVGALTIPLFSLRFGTADEGNAAPTSSTRQAYDLLAKGFGPGFNGPLEIAVQLNDGPSAAAALTSLTAAIAADRGVSAVSGARTLSTTGGSRVVAFAVYPSTSPQDAATTDLVNRLRGAVIPATVRGSGVHAFIGGGTATGVDFTHVLTSKMPMFVGIVVLLSFLLLTLLLRSILIPLTAALMNVLSTGASLGVLSAAYVWGWGGSALGASRAGPVDAALAVMVFAILFGLSMDYQVFLAARIQEEWRRTGDNRVAVTRGLAITGRTITAAALIMIVVFGSFVLGDDRMLNMFGLGLAAAVFVDAFLVRVAIVPAVMFLLGHSNWWLPRPFDAVLPHFDVDSEAPSELREFADAR